MYHIPEYMKSSSSFRACLSVKDLYKLTLVIPNATNITGRHDPRISVETFLPVSSVIDELIMDVAYSHMEELYIYGS